MVWLLKIFPDLPQGQIEHKIIFLGVGPHESNLTRCRHKKTSWFRRYSLLLGHIRWQATNSALQWRYRLGEQLPVTSWFKLITPNWRECQTSPPPKKKVRHKPVVDGLAIKNREKLISEIFFYILAFRSPTSAAISKNTTVQELSEVPVSEL